MARGPYFKKGLSPKYSEIRDYLPKPRTKGLLLCLGGMIVICLGIISL
jgi:hypothetical protein